MDPRDTFYIFYDFCLVMNILVLVKIFAAFLRTVRLGCDCFLPVTSPKLFPAKRLRSKLLSLELDL